MAYYQAFCQVNRMFGHILFTCKTSSNNILIVSESACSSDLSFHQEFSTSLLGLYNLKRVRGDGNWLFRALCLAAFGDDSVHLFVRQYVWDYLIRHKKICTIYGWGNDYRSAYCKNDDGGWVGGYSEIVAFSEMYSVQIHIFDLIASQ